MKKISWYARAGDIAKMGPYDTQIEATNAIRLAPTPTRSPVIALVSALLGKKPSPPTNDRVSPGALFHDNAFVWPEETEEP